MSRAGAADAGFTLIELLVVLTLVALLGAMAMPRLQTMLAPSIERTTRRVALAVREQRTVAMLSGRLVTLDPAALTSILPAGTVVEEAFPEDAGILFMPDGTSSGGRIVLAARGTRRAIDVDWLTGRVTVRAVP
jgi:general secretion pathway protein H